MYECVSVRTLITITIARQSTGAGHPLPSGDVETWEKGLPHGRERLPMHVITCMASQA